MNNDRATRSTLLPRPGVPPRIASVAGALAPVAHLWPVRKRTSASSTRPSTMAARRWALSGSCSVSGWSTPSSMITNRNSTTMAPAYTTTCTAARRWASCWMNSTATLTSVTTSESAECTGLRASTTPNAPASVSAPNTKKMSACIGQCPPAWSARRGVFASVSSAVIGVDRADRFRGRGLGERALVLGGRLTDLGVAHAEAELARPTDATLVDRLARWRGGAHPRAGVVVLVAEPQLPRLPTRAAVVVDEQFGLGVDRVFTVGERELEELGLGDRLGGAGLHAQVAVDAAQVVDLVDEPVALAR